MPRIRKSKKDPGHYVLNGTYGEKELLRIAEQIMEAQIVGSEILTSPEATRRYISLRCAPHEQEVFSVIFLNTRHCVITIEDMFFGTIDGASVYPREVVKNALKHNAAAVILFHNHPSGVSEPSEADTRITQRLKDALNLVDIRILDHFVVGGKDITSFAERGLL